MLHFAAAKLGVRPRDAMVVLTLVSHLFVTFGFLLPAPPFAKLKDPSRPFPCQNRPCGCLTADECWKGDCCCFTLEEKLAWAEANGIEPPEHVRPLVESRKMRSALPEKRPCCSAAQHHDEQQATAPASSCCSLKMDHPTATLSCALPTGCMEKRAPECPACAARSSKKCCDNTGLAAQPGVRWVVGIFSQKCRGEGPAGLFQFPASVLPDPNSQRLAVPEPVGYVIGVECHVISTSHRPPTPPPRRS